ncbi:UPF0246 protein YaaA [hydrothermal vent metagenome]|uniref:UPF0246 protein YaaA n=1 Tax=hydrothermal vent metagenome TaxID=652676 RepID=A0A1W1EK10_9ZZZZ
MKIVLAPSETKIIGGEDKFDISKLSFQDLKRDEIVENYQQIILNSSNETLSKLFGIKDISKIDEYRTILRNQPTIKAIQRYTGVAYDYLDYPSLDKGAQKYIDDNLLIFSNLFGVLKASDLIPNYKLKQGESIGDIKSDKFYKKDITTILDNYLKDEDILDLRAKYYEKFYKPTQKYTTLKFIKNGKVVSHWAKAYRGKVVRDIALNSITSIDELINLDIKGLSIIEILNIKNQTEIIYNIIGDIK